MLDGYLTAVPRGVHTKSLEVLAYPMQVLVDLVPALPDRFQVFRMPADPDLAKQGGGVNYS
jgi:hypothetical protein